MDNYETTPIHWINRLGFLVRKELGQRFRANGFDVSPEEWAILLILWNKGGQTSGALADATIRDRTTLTRLIDGMVSKGLVERYGDPRDRRKTLVKTSKRGDGIKHQLVSIARTLIVQTLDGISPQDIETTVKSLRLMTQNLLPDDPLPPPKGSKG